MTASTRHLRLAALWLAAVLTAVPAVAATFTASTDGGVQVTVGPIGGEIRVGETQKWHLELEDAEGATFRPLSVAATGGMPDHGHGFPEPIAVEAIGQAYRLDNVRFNMPGRWLLEIWIGTPAGIERVSIPLDVQATPVDAGVQSEFDAHQIGIIQSLSLSSLGPVPSDPSNRLTGNETAEALGKALFFETKLSKEGDVSCATCHQPHRYFTDGLARSKGSRELARNAPSLVGVGYGRWFYWDGRRDSLWAQALTPLETGGEMDSSRVDVVRYVTTHEAYAPQFQKLTGIGPMFDDPNRFPPGAGPFAAPAARKAWQRMSARDREQIDGAFAEVGKVIAAFESTLAPSPSRFDAYAASLTSGASQDILNLSERAGLGLFIDGQRTQCLRCHNGPLFTNQEFHGIGTAGGPFDMGRLIGLQAAAVDPFNCTGRHSDVANRNDCGLTRLRNAQGDVLPGAFKVPSLRNVTATGPYMHDGRFATLEQVMAHYQNPPPELGHELPPLDLDDVEIEQLIAFLSTLGEGPAGYSSTAK